MEYVRTGKRNPSLINSPVTLVSETDELMFGNDDPRMSYQMHQALLESGQIPRRLYLEISGNCTISDIEVFVRANSKLIAEQLVKISFESSKPIRLSQYAKRNERILNSYLGGQSIKDIAEREGLSYDWTYKIITRQKKTRL